MVWVEASKLKSAVRALHRPGQPGPWEKRLPGVAGLPELTFAPGQLAERPEGSHGVGGCWRMLMATAGMILSLDLTGIQCGTSLRFEPR